MGRVFAVTLQRKKTITKTKTKTSFTLNIKAMHITITRYYGDANMALGRLTVEGTDFECETSEPHYRDYSEAFQGCSTFCLPVGEHRCKCVASQFSALTLAVAKTPGHRCTLFGWHPTKERMLNAILLRPVGMESADALFERFTQLVYDAYVNGEEMMVEIRNEVCSDETLHD